MDTDIDEMDARLNVPADCGLWDELCEIATEQDASVGMVAAVLLDEALFARREAKRGSHIDSQSPVPYNVDRSTQEHG